MEGYGFSMFSLNYIVELPYTMPIEISLIMTFRCSCSASYRVPQERKEQVASVDLG